MKKFFLFSALLCLTGCTISVIVTDTHGTATDVVDDTQSQNIQPKTDLSIPVKPL